MLNDGGGHAQFRRNDLSIQAVEVRNLARNTHFLFANTPKGATGSAIMFSLIQTAMENGLDPYKYLTWLLWKAKDADLSQENAIRTLLPWNAPAECKTK